MLADVTNAIYIILYIVPFSILRYYPFIHQLRISLSRLCSIYITILLIEIVSFIWLAKCDFWNVQLAQIFRSAFATIYAILSFVVIRDKFFKQLFVYLVMFSYSAMVSRTAHMCEAFLAPYFVDLPTFFITNIAIMIQLIISYPFIYRFIKIKFTPLVETKNADVWNYIWIIPVILIIFGFLFGVDLSKDTVMDWKNYLSRWVMSLGIFFSCFVLIKVLEQTNQNATLNENIRMTNKLLAAQNNHYKLLTDTIEKTKAARHDLHHHILVLQSYLQNKQFAQLEEYLNKYQVRLSEGVQPIISKHYIVDAILQHYLAITKALTIKFTVKVELLEQVVLDDLDLCIILGNTIENAIEACQRMKNGDKFIELNIKRIGNMLVITLDNSYDGVVKATATSFVSSKRAHDDEGVGLSSIKAVVDKYQGVLDLDYTQDVFKTSIMLNLANVEIL